MAEQEPKIEDSKQENINDVAKDIDYTKISEKLDLMIEDLESMAEAVMKIKVECAVANMELASNVDRIELKSKICALEEVMEEFKNNHLLQSEMEHSGASENRIADLE